VREWFHVLLLMDTARLFPIWNRAGDHASTLLRDSAENGKCVGMSVPSPLVVTAVCSNEATLKQQLSI
jgi:hypothetical protein